MLDDWHKQREEETRRRAERRGRILVRRLLAPIAVAVALFRLWQLLTGRL